MKQYKPHCSKIITIQKGRIKGKDILMKLLHDDEDDDDCYCINIKEINCSLESEITYLGHLIETMCTEWWYIKTAQLRSSCLTVLHS